MPARVQCDYGNWVIVDIANSGTADAKRAMTGHAMLHVITFPLEVYAWGENPAQRRATH
jgi:hypothetical protein